MKKKRKAFTLAEALVVIAILAIIAGITIPVVKKQSFNEQTTTQLKKGYQSLEASLDGAIVDNGPIDNWTGDKFQKYIVPQLKTIKKCSAADISDCFSGSISGLTSAVVLPDKVVIANSGDDYYIDVNGPAAPNQIDVDIYKFVLQKVEDDSDDTAGVLAMLNNMFIPSAYAAVFTETPTMQGDDIWSHHVTDNNAAMDRFESATGGGGGGGSSPKPTVETPVYNPNTPALLPNDTLTPIDPNQPLPDEGVISVWPEEMFAAAVCTDKPFFKMDVHDFCDLLGAHPDATIRVFPNGKNWTDTAAEDLLEDVLEELERVE